MSLYAYCLSDEVTAEALAQVAGVAGAMPHLLPCGNIKAVVGEFNDERAAVTRENVMAHERVIGRVLAQTTPLPFRFGTVVTASGLQDYVSSQREQLQSLLDRVRGAVEMSVKIIWDVEAIKSATATRGGPDHLANADAPSPGPGLAFLLARRREMAGDEALKGQAEEIAAWLKGLLRDVVRDTVIVVRPAEALVITAAHLVERAKIEQYKERLRRARQERNDFYFLTSGAWPPYSFTHLRS